MATTKTRNPPLSGGKKSPAAKHHKKTLNQKHGGALGDDLKALAVPFAIILAKQGLEKQQSKLTKKNNSKGGSKEKSIMKGGTCGPCNGAGTTPPNMVGGKLNKLSKAIDNFLKKY